MGTEAIAGRLFRGQLFPFGILQTSFCSPLSPSVSEEVIHLGQLLSTVRSSIMAQPSRLATFIDFSVMNDALPLDDFDFRAGSQHECLKHTTHLLL